MVRRTDMGFLFGKKKNDVVWRDKDGKIACPGDSCPLDCDGSCPIWQNTMGTTMAQMGQYEKAIDEFRAGIKIAPDFADLWNNMAMCFGYLSRYQEAYDAYKKAYELAGKKNGLYGLALSSRDLGRIDEAKAYCTEYRKKFGDGALDQIEAQLNAKKESSGAALTYMDLLVDLLKAGNEQGFVRFDKSIPMIPELNCQADQVSQQIHWDLNDYFNEKGEDSSDFLKRYGASAIWSAFAGMGAVWYWNKDWPDLRETGIVEKLSAPEGVSCIDDVVLDAVGIGRSSTNSQKVRDFLQNASNNLFDKMLKATNGDPAAMIKAFTERNKAMYFLGIAMEMHRLGMN